MRKYQVTLFEHGGVRPDQFPHVRQVFASDPGQAVRMARGIVKNQLKKEGQSLVQFRAKVECREISIGGSLFT